MSRLDYQIEMISELAQSILKAGLRVFIAERGTYGFFTNEEGTRVVSFQADLGGISFSGNYKTSAPHLTGTGWRIMEGVSLNVYQIKGLLKAYPPYWAVKESTWRYTTLEEHLKSYQASSRYKEMGVKDEVQNPG